MDKEKCMNLVFGILPNIILPLCNTPRDVTCLSWQKGFCSAPRNGDPSFTQWGDCSLKLCNTKSLTSPLNALKLIASIC